MKITDMMISALLKKGILYEARNVDTDVEIPMIVENQEHKIKINTGRRPILQSGADLCSFGANGQAHDVLAALFWRCLSCIRTPCDGEVRSFRF